MTAEQERERWELLRRTLLAVVAQTRDMIPHGELTLAIAIAPRDQPSTPTP